MEVETTSDSAEFGSHRGSEGDRVKDILLALDLSHACIRGMDGTVKFWCTGNERLYGWLRDEAVGHTTHSLLKTRFPKPLEEIEAELLERGVWDGELLHTTKAGGEVWVASHWVLQRNPDGSARAVIEVNNDITSTRRADETARYLASIIDSSDDAIVGKSLDGTVTSWNSGAERIFGYSAAEMIGCSILKLFPPELRSEETSIQERIQRGERIDHYETVRITKPGNRIAVSLTVSPIKSDLGEIVGASKIARDISQRKAFEEALAESEERQRLAVEAGDLGLWSFAANSGTWYWSARSKAILRLSAEAEVPSYEEIFRFVHPEDEARVDETFKTALGPGSAFEIEFRVLGESGDVHWVQARGRPCVGPSGVVFQVHGTLLDFTRRKQTEDALRRMNSQLQQFAYAAAHDLQEPLRNVALSIQLAQVQSQSMDAETRVLLDSAAKNALKMAEMVKDLLAYSRALHEDDRQWPVTNCSEVLVVAMENLALGILEAKAQITWDELPAIRMDRIHLLQLFQNLIGNALKYRGPEPPRIHVGSSFQKNFCRLSVSDNGVGIEPQFHERIFGVFKRLRKTDASGTGLGLALCKRIVEHYGGEIWVESDGKHGATFFFTAPWG